MHSDHLVFVSLSQICMTIFTQLMHGRNELTPQLRVTNTMPLFDKMLRRNSSHTYQSRLLDLFQSCTLNRCLAAPNCLKLSRRKALIGTLIPSWQVTSDRQNATRQNLPYVRADSNCKPDKKSVTKWINMDFPIERDELDYANRKPQLCQYCFGFGKLACQTGISALSSSCYSQCPACNNCETEYI